MSELYIGLYRDCLETWGIEAQLGMVQEECAELIVAVNKMFRKGIRDPQSFANFVEELADVEIMCREMREFPGVQEALLPVKLQKLERLKARLKESKEKKS